jgi:hypothetical protein
MHFEDDLVVREWVGADKLGLFIQSGVLESPGPTRPLNRIPGSRTEAPHPEPRLTSSDRAGPADHALKISVQTAILDPWSESPWVSVSSVSQRYS